MKKITLLVLCLTSYFLTHAQLTYEGEVSALSSISSNFDFSDHSMLHSNNTLLAVNNLGVEIFDTLYQPVKTVTIDTATYGPYCQTYFISDRLLNSDDKLEIIFQVYDQNYDPIKAVIMDEDGIILFELTGYGFNKIHNRGQIPLISFSNGSTTKFYRCGGSLPPLVNVTNQIVYTSVDDTLNVDLVSSTGSITQNSFSIWSNANTLYYEFQNSGNYQILMFNANAQILYQENSLLGTSGSISFSGYTPGIYFVTVNDNNGLLRSETRKIVIH